MSTPLVLGPDIGGSKTQLLGEQGVVETRLLGRDPVHGAADLAPAELTPTLTP
jgi:hypothetical protein